MNTLDEKATPFIVVRLKSQQKIIRLSDLTPKYDPKHNASTCRMSRTPATGVIDGNLHVHGVKNLMVASTAALPVISDANTAYSARLVGLEAVRVIKGQ